MKASTGRQLTGAVWLVFGTGLARIMPIFIGMLFARQFDPATYAGYVAFVIACNLVAAIPLMGTTQLMLSERANMGVAHLLRQYMGPHLLLQLACWACVAGLTWLMRQSDKAQADAIHLLALYVFSLGYCLTGVTAAAYNKVGQHTQAGWCWIGSTVTSAMAAGLGAYWHVPANQAIAYLAVGWLAGGLLCASRGFLQHTTHLEGDASPATATPSLLQIVVFGAPSVVYLLGFYLLTQNALHSDEAHFQGVFSLGYQLFSAALFLPGVMGNITTPRLVRLQASAAQHRQFVLQLLLAYASAATLWCSFIYLSIPLLLTIFHLPHTSDTVALVLWIQAAAAIAMVQALLNQLMASERMSVNFLVAACAWLLVTLAFPNQASHATQSAAHALVAAYVVCLTYSTLAWRLSRPRINTTP